MADGNDDGASAPPDSGGRRRFAQAGLAALCVLGLVVAALATPAVSGPAAPELDGSGGDRGADGGGDGGIGDGDGDDGDPVGRIPGLEELLRWLLPDEPADPEPGAPACELSVTPRPTPDRTVTVTVTRADDPVAGALVSVDGDVVGRTDDAGRVRARVPYVRSLAIEARLPGGEGCTAGRADTAASALAGPPRPPANVAAQERAADSTTVSRTVEVDGTVEVAVEGDADPGTTVGVRAAIEGIPMREATVSANGRTVATTDDEGTATVPVPADGTEHLRIVVERGAFAGRTSIAVRHLDARVVPVGLLAVPGEPAAVRTTLGADPAAGAVVSLDGRRLGTTGPEGRLRFALPADPRATLSVRLGDRTVTTGVAWLYAGTAAVLAVPVLVLAAAVGLAYRRGATPGRVGRRLARLFGVLGRAIGAVARRLVWAALLVATAIERLLRGLAARLARLLGLARRLAGLGRDALPTVLATIRHRLRSLPGAAGAWLRRTVGRLWRLPWRLWAAFGSDRDRPAVRGGPAGRLPTELSAPFDLRRAWRAVARLVAPARWRVRTPREIVRAAETGGFPREPVERLASIFEAVEYGGRPLSADRRARARSAVRTLLSSDPDGDPDGPGADADRHRRADEEDGP